MTGPADEAPSQSIRVSKVGAYAVVISREERARKIIDAETNDFAKLLRLSGLDPQRHLRFADWAGISFRGCDLRGFDFTGARLSDSDFTEALVEGARFDQAEIQGANLRAAKDWAAHLTGWSLPQRLLNVDASLPRGAVFQDAPFAPELVVIQPGRFMMGSPEDEEGRWEDEGPWHEVMIPHRLAVGRYPVTFADWDFAAVSGGMKGYRPEDQGWGRGRRPVINVSWKDAQTYVAWLRHKTGQAYRLLSEAEWEYCCRAGSQTRYSFGDDARGLRKYAWYDVNSGGQTHPVGEKKPNIWGLYDTHGNVEEWVEDRWNENYTDKPKELNANSGAWTTGHRSLHVVRGGSWYDDYLRDLRSAYRGGLVSDYRLSDIGFRVARTLTS